MKRLCTISLILLCCLMVACTQRGGQTQPPLVEATPYAVPEAETVTAELFFLRGADTWRSEERKIAIQRDTGLWLQIVEELIKGPQASGLSRVCPQNITVSAAAVMGNIAMVDVADSALTKDEWQQLRMAISKTLYACGGVEYVVLTQNGSIPFGMPYPIQLAEDEDGSQSETFINVYYKDTADTYAMYGIVKLEKNISIQSVLGALQNREYELGEGPLDKDVKLTGYSFWEGMLSIQLRGENNLQPDALSQSCIALALQQSIAGVQRVEIVYNDVVLTGGAVEETLTSEEILKKRGLWETLYLMDSRRDGLIKVQRPVPISEAFSIYSCVDQVLSGPQPNDSVNAIAVTDSAKDSFIGGYIYEHVVALNFTDAFYEKLNEMTDDESRTFLYAIINTVTEHTMVEQVLFLQNGETPKAVKNYVFSQPLLNNPGIIKQSDE